MKKLMELLEKKYLNLEEIEEIEENEHVVECENCGISGINPSHIWFNVKLENGEEYDIYFIGEE